MSTATSLNLSALLKTAAARSGMDAPARAVTGLTPAAKALYVAAAAQARLHEVVTYVVPADEHGEFAVRGGIVDIFPAGEAHPVRLEFIGDTIESLRTYDPATQRSIATIDQAAIVPLRDVLQDERTATLFDYLARAKTFR